MLYSIIPFEFVYTEKLMIAGVMRRFSLNDGENYEEIPKIKKELIEKREQIKNMIKPEINRQIGIAFQGPLDLTNPYINEIKYFRGFEIREKSYPVLYFLTGWGDTVNVWFDRTYGLSINQTMDAMIDAESSKEMIVVVVSGTNRFGGSFYTNSPVTGNWEDFVVNEVVSNIDSSYRTIKSKNSRGIAGHSMGGYGAAYGMSPGIFDENGLKDFLFSTDSNKTQLINKKSSYDAMSTTEAATARTSWFGEIAADGWGNIKYGYGLAFAGNSAEKCYMDVPYENSNGAVIANTNLAKWENGYGNIKAKIADYKAKTVKLNAIGAEVGNADEYVWLMRGCDYFNTEMKSAGITLTYEKFSGKHEDRLKERFENAVLPFFNENLTFE